MDDERKFQIKITKFWKLQRGLMNGNWLGRVWKVQSLSHVLLFATPWTAAHQASLSVTNSGAYSNSMKRQSQSTNNTQLWMWLVMEIKVQCCKKQYCIGPWNVKSMNQGKLEIIKQEMARLNIDILRINELQGTGMGEFNSDDHFIYYYEQESLRRNGVAIMVNMSLKCSTWMQSQKWQNDLCSFPR